MGEGPVRRPADPASAPPEPDGPAAQGSSTEDPRPQDEGGNALISPDSEDDPAESPAR